MKLYHDCLNVVADVYEINQFYLRQKVDIGIEEVNIRMNITEKMGLILILSIASGLIDLLQD